MSPAPTEIADRLDRDGVAFARGYVDLPRCETARAAFEDAGHNATRRGGVRLDLRATDSAAWRQLLPALSDLAAAAGPSDAEARLVAVRAILFDKAPHANWLVPWHQDRSVALDRRDDDAPGFGPWSIKNGVVSAAQES